MNELFFLGTGAADWDINDKNEGFRRFSACMLNKELLFDCGPHLYDFEESFEYKDLYKDIKSLLITHGHSDHFSEETVAGLAESKKITVLCDEKTKEILCKYNTEFVSAKLYEKTTIGGYEITPLLANHDVVINETERACHYIVKTKDDKELFYGLDGAWFLRSSWEEMKKHKFDVMVLDCTVGDFHDWRLFEHNTIQMLRAMVKEIKDVGMIKQDGKIIASHLAKTLHTSFDETKEILQEMGVILAYDNMKVLF